MKNILKKIGIINAVIIMFVTFFLEWVSISDAASYYQYVKSGISSFPADYQVLLNELVASTGHSNWTFKAYYTGVDWDELVSYESVCKVNRVGSGFDTAHRCSCGNLASGYYCADGAATAYFMDPRNFITERNMFQFLEISYDSSIHTRSIVHSLVSQYAVFNYGNNVTFTRSDTNKSVTMSYTDIIMAAAEASQMSPISIVIKIVQEVGSSGSSSVTGTYPGYEGLYNFFNIGAYDSGNAIENGLAYAKTQGWYCPYVAIVEGSEYNAKNYIQAGQNTAYFYKYDVVGTSILETGKSQTVSSSNLYNHQYMTNIQDPYSQSISLFSTYTNNGMLDENLSFVIPVYNNMPDVVNKPSSLSNSTGNLYYADITSSVNVRSGAGTSYSIASILYKDDLVLLLSSNAGTANGYTWCKIQLWDGTIAYIPDIYLSKFTASSSSSGSTSEGTLAIQPNIGYGYANVSSSLNVRSGAGTSYSILTQLTGMEEAIILSETGSWYKIKTSSNILGYVSKDYFVKLDYINKSGTTITVGPGITANIVAGYMDASSYTVKNGSTTITDYTLGTGYTYTQSGTAYTIVKTGDVNGDGKVNTIDALLIQRHVVKLSTLSGNYLAAADINGDGSVNTVDALLIQRYVVKLSQINI